ncbi:MAG: nicotinate-nucleotide--dimethylbenzimidazole phosphoribosyltransferase [Desulfobacterales bacterium]
MKLEDIIKGIQPVEDQWIQKSRERTAQLVMPTRALGRLHDISERLCGIQKTLKPKVNRKAILFMAGDHGVADEGVSAFPQEVTGAMVRTFLLKYLGIEAVLDLGMRLGEGTGGALAMSIIEGATCVFNEVLTFEEAGVADKA